MENNSFWHSNKNKPKPHKQNITKTHHKEVAKSKNKNFKQFISKLGARVKSIKRKRSKEAVLKSLGKTIEICASSKFISFEAVKMINNIINIGDVKVDDIMTPRGDIIAIHNNVSLTDIKDLTISNEHSRMPVYKDNLDEIIGFVHSKDLIKFIDNHQNGTFKINSLIRKILFVPESMRIIDLLLKMRSSRVHIAIVLDEYGGTNGLVTIEDIMEEIVGEIEDEFDVPNNNIYMTIKQINDNIIHVGGRVDIKKVEELLKIKISEDDNDLDFDTVGGFVLSAFKKVPESGEVVKYGNELIIKVLDADVRSVKLVEIKLN